MLLVLLRDLSVEYMNEVSWTEEKRSWRDDRAIFRSVLELYIHENSAASSPRLMIDHPPGYNSHEASPPRPDIATRRNSH